MDLFLECVLPDRLLEEASIERTIERIGNTRRRVPPKDDRLLGTVLDYGLGDVIDAGFADSGDRQKLAALWANRIELFEPRLFRVAIAWDREVEAPKLRYVGQAHCSDGSGQVQLTLELAENQWKCTLKELHRHG